ncbi:hypothetical protein KEM54_005314 [Ascosphaera aggregata]|nr:hypothetical protein KEM54_005314 [Ascosphaera aggregata]
MVINSLWFQWKSMKLPWRKSFLAGVDLNGNTFWEFKDAINTGRMRRIVKADPKMHHADLRISPQWLQWLRHARRDAPTIEEQKADLVRQARLKQLAQIADAKWMAKKSHIEAPILTEAQRRQLDSIKSQQHDFGKPSAGAAAGAGAGAGARAAAETGNVTTTNTAGIGETKEVTEEPEVTLRGQKVKNPFATNKPSAPSENWQPEAWAPAPKMKQ